MFNYISSAKKDLTTRDFVRATIFGLAIGSPALLIPHLIEENKPKLLIHQQFYKAVLDGKKWGPNIEAAVDLNMKIKDAPKNALERKPLTSDLALR